MSMKKCISCFALVVLLLSIFTNNIFALDSSTMTRDSICIEPIQMVLYKWSLKRDGLSEIDIAKAILTRLDYPKSIIQAMSEEKLLKIANSRFIETKEEYVCIHPDGATVTSTKAQYEAERTTLPEASVLRIEDEISENSWVRLQTSIWQNDTNKTDFSFLVVCTWLTNPIQHLTDQIALATTEGSLTPDSVWSLLTYQEFDYKTGQQTAKYSEKIGQSQITVIGRLTYSSLPLPANYYNVSSIGEAYGKRYTDFCAALWIDGHQYSTDAMTFNLGSAYFHQIISFGSPSLSVGGGASISISPQLNYSKIHCTVEFQHEI